MSNRNWIFETSGTQQFKMATDFKAARFVFPIRAVGLDKIAVHQTTAFGKRLEAARINIRNRLLAAEVVQCPS